MSDAESDRTLGERIDVFENDIWLIVATMIGIYLLFIAFSVALIPIGQLANGIANTLQRITFLTAVYAMMVLALNLHWGYTGLFNIGVAGYMAVAVYTMAMLSNPTTGTPPGLGIPYAFAAAMPMGGDLAAGAAFFVGLLVCVVLGMVMASLVGAITALPALRLKADYLAIVTVALAEIIRLTLLSTTFQTFTVPLVNVQLGTGAGRGINLPTNPVRAIYFNDPTNPATGLTGVGEAVFGFFDVLGITQSVVVSGTYTLVLIAFVAGFYWLLVRVGNSPFGRLLKAIREDEEVGQSLGKDTRLVKVKVFMLGCALMGLGGILWEGSKGFTDPTSTTFLPLQTFYIFIALIIGGSGSNTGSVLGGALFASLLFEGPFFVSRLLSEYLDLQTAPPTFAAAVGQVFQLDPMAFLAYVLGSVSELRFVLVGILLILLMQYRPEGLLGHRKEEAASVDLGRQPVADGGESDE